MNRDPQFFDDLAHVVRRHFSGLVRPLWADLPDEVRAERRHAAERLTEFLEANGFTVQRINPNRQNRQEQSEC